MLEKDIAYIKTEPMPPGTRCQHVSTPHFRCTIELSDGSTIIRCGETELHALANAWASYKTTPRSKEVPSSSPQ